MPVSDFSSPMPLDLQDPENSVKKSKYSLLKDYLDKVK